MKKKRIICTEITEYPDGRGRPLKKIRCRKIAVYYEIKKCAYHAEENPMASIIRASY